MEVGERGRELFVPETNGSIISSNMLNNAGSGGGTNVYITNNSSNSQIEQETDDNGDVYVKISDLDQMVGAALSNPNSDSYQGLSSVASLQRN
ncbi:hypothetical protein NVP1198A_38 [Vibrio phage 1.198.A._10N.286.54.F4]|nr:hypothetical protein NVP1198A_38 [Vibrio phage 1.198.A._10N.286.54.F4]